MSRITTAIETVSKLWGRRSSQVENAAESAAAHAPASVAGRIEPPMTKLDDAAATATTATTPRITVKQAQEAKAARLAAEAAESAKQALSINQRGFAGQLSDALIARGTQSTGGGGGGMVNALSSIASFIPGIGGRIASSMRGGASPAAETAGSALAQNISTLVNQLRTIRFDPNYKLLDEAADAVGRGGKVTPLSPKDALEAIKSGKRISNASFDALAARIASNKPLEEIENAISRTRSATQTVLRTGGTVLTTGAMAGGLALGGNYIHEGYKGWNDPENASDFGVLAVDAVYSALQLNNNKKDTFQDYGALWYGNPQNTEAMWNALAKYRITREEVGAALSISDGEKKAKALVQIADKFSNPDPSQPRQRQPMREALVQSFSEYISVWSPQKEEAPPRDAQSLTRLISSSLAVQTGNMGAQQKLDLFKALVSDDESPSDAPAASAPPKAAAATQQGTDSKYGLRQEQFEERLRKEAKGNGFTPNETAALQDKFKTTIAKNNDAGIATPSQLIEMRQNMTSILTQAKFPAGESAEVVARLLKPQPGVSPAP